jgi:tRNA(Ile)-lysidine synthase
VVEWPGGELRRYRGRLYLLPPLGESCWPPQGRALTATPVPLGEGMGALTLVPDAPRGLSAATLARGLSVRMRCGGEQIKPAGQAHTKKLKKLLQDEGVVPWMRDRLPLVFAGDELVAVADLWVAAGATSEPGTTVRWDGRPELY